VLSLFAIGLGFFSHKFGNYLGAQEGEAVAGKPIVMGLSIAVGLLGIFLGWLVYGRKTMEHASDPDPLAVNLGGLFTVLNRKWYIDEFYEATVFRFTAACVDGILHVIVFLALVISQIFRGVGDEFFINGGFDASCESVRLGGKVLAKLQSGRVQNYFRVLSLGAAILLLIYFFA
jgi:NADH-quinone oxidoreductase subunit L